MVRAIERDYGMKREVRTGWRLALGLLEAMRGEVRQEKNQRGLDARTPSQRCDRGARLAIRGSPSDCSSPLHSPSLL
jgi:hypothetical protein